MRKLSWLLDGFLRRLERSEAAVAFERGVSTSCRICNARFLSRSCAACKQSVFFPNLGRKHGRLRKAHG
jgi:hypothetical protein